MFKLLNTFKIVYESKNFSEAAEMLFISQPAVSNQMKQLEEELGCPLFTRKGKQEMEPTEAATILYQRLLHLTDDWTDTLSEMKQDYHPKVVCKIGASHTFSVYYLPELMVALTTEFGQVEFELEMGNSEEVLEKIQKHDLHFGFIEKPLVTDGVERVAILEDYLVLSGDVDSDTWLCREPTSGVFHYMEQYLRSQNITEKKMIVKNNEMIVKLLEKGIGKSVVSSKAIPVGVPYERLNDAYRRPFYYLQKEHITNDDLVAVGEYIKNYYTKKDGLSN